MRGFSEARLNTNSDVAITLMGCKLFCATQRNLHQVNVQVLHLCVDEALQVKQIVKDYALYSIMFSCVLKAKEVYGTKQADDTFLKARQ